MPQNLFFYVLELDIKFGLEIMKLRKSIDMFN